MIVTEKKSLAEIVAHIRGDESVFVIGCGDCATTCATGGRNEVEQLVAELKTFGKTVSGSVVIDTVCDERLVRQHSRRIPISLSDTVIVLACGAGVQAVAETTMNRVVPGLNTVFPGKIKNLSHFVEVCSACGDCIVGNTGGICPVTRCPKQLLNGPCGGASEGKCEVNREQECAWQLIYDRLVGNGNMEYLNGYQNVRTGLQSHRPRRLYKSR